MELRHLRSFISVAQELSFTQAARKLHLAQPALSRHIRQLEDELGVRLFERNRRGTRLTGPGKAFLGEALAVIDQSERAIQTARDAEKPVSPCLNLGYVWALFHNFIPAQLVRFRKLFPTTAVHLFDLTVAEQASGLIEGRLDAAFIGFAHDADAFGLAKQRVGSCTMVAALPEGHAAASKSKVHLASLAKEFFLVISEANYPGASRLVLQACANAGFRPRIIQTVERGFPILSLVAARCGVALLPEPLKDLPHPGVVLMPLAEPIKGDLFVAWRSGNVTSARRTLLDVLRNPE